MKITVRPVIVLIPYPAQGHITPMLNLGRALHCHGFRPIMALPDFIHDRITTTADELISFISIPTNLSNKSKDFFAIDRAMEESMPEHLERELKELRSEGEVACLVVDLLTSAAIRVAERVGVRVVGFWPAMLATYRVVSAIPELIRQGIISDCGTPLHQYNQQFIKLEEDDNDNDNDEDEKVANVLLPTIPKLSTKDFPWLVGDPSSQRSRFKFWLRTMGRANTLPYLLINSFPQEDGKPSELSDNGPTIFPVGPFLSSTNNLTMWEEDKSCMNWLDKQPHASVIYISFGSWVGPIKPEKMAELALGLEATKRPFLWALRDNSPWRNGLPLGFLDRTTGRVKIVNWAPQEAVLAHQAVGCFVTHCGWNSIVEAIRYGKKFVCYPISGDQFLNCKYIVKVWRIGVKIERLERREVEESVRKVMEDEEGEEIQERVLGLREKVMGIKGRSKAEGNLQVFVNEIRNHVL